MNEDSSAHFWIVSFSVAKLLNDGKADWLAYKLSTQKWSGSE